MNVTIRQMRGADRAGLMDILQGIPQFQGFDVAVAAEVIDCYLNKGTPSGYQVLVAEEKQGLAGFICFGPTPLTEGTWDIYWEAVAPQRQGKGIGRALIKAAEAEAGQSRARQVLVETSSISSYEKTVSFYKHNGYEIISKVPDFYSSGDDRLILRKIIKKDNNQSQSTGTSIQQS